ncbi:MAG TPA: glycosyltransferase, partial [Candidatus Atribacteria bacterium]|nr:glycosyltransferase [Candidatus Atribacteria bacterium]
LSNRPLLLLGVLLMIIGVQFIVFGFLAEISIRTYFTNKKTYTIEKVIE